MNKHILLVMKYLKGPKSVSREELGENRKSARAAYDAAYESAVAAYYASVAASVGAVRAAYWVDKYFEHTGEDKQTYINELEKS